MPVDTTAVTVPAESWPRFGNRRYERPDEEQHSARALVIPAPDRDDETLRRLLALADRRRDVTTNPADIGGYALVVPAHLWRKFVA
ncbi:hypothetical protein [Micromonospora aurantiaca (nom. illeg.)]|uniref:hypothetical protein n=1 Tax=Micromonospora aurantiaca (nom. illeg.) TaxID=47850 RepID=UPI0036787701